LKDALSEPFVIEGHELVLSPSIGIAIGDQEIERTDELLRRADVAMYDAKSRGKARYSLFRAEMDESAWERLAMEADLRRAVQSGQLRLHYQPILSLEGGHIAEVEALVRWQHPERGLLFPNDFIPLAEETGLINQVGQWVLEEACRQAASWRSVVSSERPVLVAVNLSARQFQQPGIVEDVANALEHAQLDPRCLKIEITETVAMSDIANASSTLHALKALGVTLAVDDFGAGYSGMSYLLRSPIDAIKIDRSYVREVAESEEDRRTIQAVLAFASTLELTVVAEGVETADQLATLRGLGVHHGQGFLFSRPIPPDSLTRQLVGDQDALIAATVALTV
jgi:EAL domain-containing protein (putative c-di-GMP-specific phosphodiesterase class I)